MDRTVHPPVELAVSTTLDYYAHAVPGADAAAANTLRALLN